MGADLLMAALWKKADTELNFDAGIAAIETLTLSQLIEYVDFACPFERASEEEESDEQWAREIRERIKGQVEELRGVADPKVRIRDFTDLVSPDGQYEVWLSGGMSWGESPTELFDVFNELGCLPSVLEAIGFAVHSTNSVRLTFFDGNCPRHGGTWGADTTCEHCTYGDGSIRPPTDPGPMGPGQADQPTGQQ